MTAVAAGPVLVADPVRPALMAAVDRLDEHLRLVSGYQFGWWDADGSPTEGGGGKGMRPRLVLLGAQTAGADPEVAVPGAVAVELVHTFSLLHDDIMDGDVERRHRPSAWTVFGSASAILAGDALLALAGDVLLESGSPAVNGAQRCLAGATRRLIAGQSADLGFERRGDVRMAECLRMAADKTAALISSACALGGILADVPSAQVLALAGYGEALGSAFQVADDLLGIWGRTEVTGKPVLADLQCRKKSIPVVAALTSGTPAGEQLRRIYQQSGPLTEVELRRAARLVERAGGRAAARAELDRQLAVAADHLAALAAPPRIAGQLRDVLDQVAGSAA